MYIDLYFFHSAQLGFHYSSPVLAYEIDKASSNIDSRTCRLQRAGNYWALIAFDIFRSRRMQEKGVMYVLQYLHVAH